MEKGKGAEVQGKKWPQIVAVLLACLSAFTCGALFNWTSPSIAILIAKDHPLQITLEQASYLTVLPPIGAILMAFPACFLVDSFGRKLTMLLIAVPHLLSWILIAIGNSLWIFYASRFITGIADTLLFACLPVYIGEVTTPEVRGSWGNAMTFLLFIGGFLVNLIGAYCSITLTAIIFGVVPMVFFVGFSYMPESPYFCIIKGRKEDALESLRWLRGSEDVDEEYKEISGAVKRQLAESGKMKDLFVVKSNRKAVVISIMMRFSQQFAGISAFSVYAQHLFKEAGGDISASTSAIIFSGVMMVVSFIASVFLNRLGRRMSLFISGGGCITVLFVMGTFLYLKTIIDLSQFLWFPVVGMIAFIILFAMGFGIVPTLMLGEIFSSSIKCKALALMNVLFGIFVATSTKIFQVLLSAYGLYAPFFFYGVCCFVGTVVCYFIMVETRGKTLDEIQLELKGIKPVRKSKVVEEVVVTHM